MHILTLAISGLSKLQTPRAVKLGYLCKSCLENSSNLRKVALLLQSIPNISPNISLVLAAYNDS